MGTDRVQTPSQNYFSFPRHRGHNPWLDGLRALAILFVLLRHGVRIQPGGHTDSFVHNVMINGWIGVDLFFVLSGYLIAKALLKRMGNGAKAFSWRYFEDRILRIVPAYYAVLILCVIGFFPGFAISPDGLDGRFVYHLLFLHDYLGSNINVVFWSLGVEEKFYLLVPFLMMALLKIRSLGGQMAICAALLMISPISRLMGFAAMEGPEDYGTFFYQLRSPFHMSLEGFVAGIVVALLQLRGLLLSPRLAKGLLAACLAGLILWTGSHEFLGSITRFDAGPQPLLLSGLFGLMVLCGVSLSGQYMPTEPLVRVKARLSYTLYLIHYPLIPLAFGLAPEGATLMFWLYYLFLSFTAAAILHFLVEKPFLKLKAIRAAPQKTAPLKPA